MSAMYYQRERFPADPAHVRAARVQLRRSLRTAHIPELTVHAVVTAANEALHNAATHAYKPGGSHDEREPSHAPRRDQVVELTMLIDPDQVLVAITDFGQWRGPETNVPEHGSPGLPAGNSRGITLMSAQVDEVAIHRDPRGTTVLLRSVRSATSTAAAL